MPRAEQMPSWLESRQQQQKRQAGSSAPFGGSNLANYVGGFQPNLKTCSSLFAIRNKFQLVFGRRPTGVKFLRVAENEKAG